MNTKILLLLLGGMSLSFVLVLGIMMSLVGNNRSDPTQQASNRRLVISESVPRPQRTDAPTISTPETPPKDAESTPPKRRTSPPPSRTTEQASRSKKDSARPALTEQSPPPVMTELKTNPATLREFTTLKGELRREIGALKEDRDSMIRSLAKVLADLSPAAISKELESLDDEMAANVLRYLDKEKRQAALARLDSQRADRIRRRLRKLGVR